MSSSRERGARPRSARRSSGSIGRRRACCGWQRVRANPASRCCGGPPRWSRSPAFFARPPRVKRRPAWETRDEADDSRDRVLDPRRLRQGGLPGLAAGRRTVAAYGRGCRPCTRCHRSERALHGTFLRGDGRGPAPRAIGEVPWNVAVIRAFAERGRIALLGPHGEELVSAEAHGPVALPLVAPLFAGAEYSLALDRATAPGQAFTAAHCTRNAAPALQGGAAQLSVRDTGMTASLVLDWPAQIELTIEDSRGTAVTAAAGILCAPPARGPPGFP